MGLADLISGGLQSISIEQALEEGVSPKQIIMNAFLDTCDYLFQAAGNEGQLSIINNEIIPNLETSTTLALASAPEYDWEEITTNYHDAVGEMVEEANNIMHESCRVAEELAQAVEEAIEEAMIDALTRINPLLGFFARIASIIGDIGEEAEDREEDSEGSFF